MESWTHKLAVKQEDGSKVEMALTVNLAGLSLENFISRGLSDLAANSAKVVRDGTKTADEFMSEFQEIVERYSRGEKVRREGGVKVDTFESLAIGKLAASLRDKNAKGTLATAKTPIPRLEDPPKTEKGAVNYRAWAKILKEQEHPWYAIAYKLVSTDKMD